METNEFVTFDIFSVTFENLKDYLRENGLNLSIFLILIYSYWHHMRLLILMLLVYFHIVNF